jgi:hypothetical protein
MMSLPRVPYVYSDYMVSSVLVDYSDQILNRKHDDSYRTPTGFQDILGDRSSGTHRTRAAEIFYAGLLRGPVINPQSANAADIPYGWLLVQSDSNIHTKLGFLAYAIGRAIRNGADSPKITRAMDVVTTIVLLQIGMEHDGRWLLICSLYGYILKYFKKPTGVNLPTWHRYVAAAMFCVLADAVKRGSLVSTYLSGRRIKSLVWTDKDGNSTAVSPAGLATMAQEGSSLNDVKGPKSSLFWIGNPDHPPLRGLYTRGLAGSSTLVAKASEIEATNTSAGSESPFRMLIDKPHDREAPCALEILAEIFSADPVAKLEWEATMRTLYSGVIESLRFLDAVLGEGDRRILFAHDPEDTELDSHEVQLVVHVDDCHGEPRENDIVVLNGSPYVVHSVDMGEGRYSITSRRVSG